MLKTLRKKCEKLFIKSKKQTAICKICFSPIKTTNIGNLICKNDILCKDCQNKFKPIFKHFKIANINALSIYEYDENMKSLLYQFKGCFDYELKDVFIKRFAEELSLFYHGYIIVPVPSYIIDDEKRGFNHVKEIFSCLKNSMLSLVVKSDEYKQSAQKKNQRVNIIKHLKMSHIEQVKNKKILIVDDVYTTGNTINAMIQLIKEGNPSKIKVLVLTKVNKFSDENII